MKQDRWKEILVYEEDELKKGVGEDRGEQTEGGGSRIRRLIGETASRVKKLVIGIRGSKMLGGKRGEQADSGSVAKPMLRKWRLLLDTEKSFQQAKQINKSKRAK